MKKILSLLLLSAVIGIFAQGMPEDVRQTLYGAIDQSASSLKSAPFGKKTVAILPIPGDDSGLIAGRLKNILTRQGFTCVEGKEDPMWNEIIKEIAWNERKDDILDPKTLVKFGKLKSAQILLYGRIRQIDRNNDRTYAEIELHATDIATKQHIWGGNFAFRLYKNKDFVGIISLDNELRMLLKKNFAEAQKSIVLPETAAKLNQIKTVSVIPLAGDIDRYMTGLAVEMLSQTRHLPKMPEIPSLSQTRIFAREHKIASDALFYGTVRDLHKTKPVSKVISRGKMRDTYQVNADIQLFLEDIKTGVILWSKTITLSETVTEERVMTAAEREAARKAKINSISDDVKDDLTDNFSRYLLIAAIVIGGIILLAGAFFLLKVFLSSRTIR